MKYDEYRKHLQDHIISLKGDVWAHKVSCLYQLSACTKPGQRIVIYLFDIWFWNFSDSVVFFVSHFNNR